MLAEIIGQGCATAEFLDRWRTPGAAASRVWEERFGEQVYGPLAEAAMADALKQAGLTPGQVDHLIVAGLHARAVSRTVRAAGVPAEAVTDNLAASIGNAGTAQPGILLADVLDRAGPGETVLLVVLADGADCAGTAHHRGAGRPPPAAAGRRADRRGQHRAGVRHLPVLARVPGPRAAPPAGPGPGRGAARAAPDGLEVRARRGEVHPLRHAKPAAGTGSASTATRWTRWPPSRSPTCPPP